MSKLKLEVSNPNYAAVVVTLERFVELENCNNVKAAIIFGNSVIVGKDEKEGTLGVFFPVETRLDHAFLGANNLYRHPQWGNEDKNKKGFFEEHGRVKAVKFRGYKSEGFWMPLSCLAYTGIDTSQLSVGDEFNIIDGKEICQKYVARTNPSPLYKKQGRQPRLEDQIVDGQFRFHIDTDNLRRNAHKLFQNDIISISDKWHGTSAAFANILVNRKLNWFERLLQRLGVKIQDKEYGFTWSSRRVVKGVAGEAKEGSVHYYGSDVWGEVAKEIQPLVPKGFTLYGEIVGYTSEGKQIQSGYHYGCQPGKHRFLVYRITFTNSDGKVIELTWNQIERFCNRTGLEMVKTFYHGYAHDFFSKTGWMNTTDISLDDDYFSEEILTALEGTYIRDGMCPHNDNKVPAEGIVVKVDHLDEAIAFKLKSFKFLEYESKELDKGEVDIETEQSVSE